MTTIEEFLSEYSKPVQAVAIKLRMVVREVIPEANEHVDTSYKVIEYSSEDKTREALVYIAPFKDSVNLGFFVGTSLPDPNKLLRGTGKNLRHVKFKIGDTIDTAALRALIAAAWAEDQKLS